MNDSTREISPLRQRMLEDMRLRKLAPHTQAGYVRADRVASSEILLNDFVASPEM